MIFTALLALTSAAAPVCSFGDYISVCNFTPSGTGAFRIASTAQASAQGPGPHRLTSEYVINGLHCRRTDAWAAGSHSTRANCVARLNAGSVYHVVATTNAQNAAHTGRVSIVIEPTRELATLHP
jgi:hypothetical protein